MQRTKTSQACKNYDLRENHSKYYSDPGIWKTILEYHRDFITGNSDPRQFTHLRPEIAESWIRSKAFGIDPFNPGKTSKKLEPAQFQSVLEENKLLLNIARPLMDAFREFVMGSNYILWLFDRNCVSLYCVGKNNAPHSGQLETGYVSNEQAIGTSCHALAMLNKQPIHMIGPEQYCVNLHEYISSSAPILDEKGELLGILSLAHWMGNKPWNKYQFNLHIHTLGWISSLALAIGNQLQLSQSYDYLQEINTQVKTMNDTLVTANRTLQATLSYIDEGLITIDQSGRIINSNREAARIFKLDAKTLSNHNIFNFISDTSNLTNILHGGKKVEYQEMELKIMGKKEPYMVNIHPIINPTSKIMDVAIIRLNHASKVNALVNTVVGARAKFTFQDIIGNSDQMRKAKSLTERFANSPENILLTGESGTGKELFAQSIHNKSRPNGPFIAINCAAMPRNLIESELFGYEPGAFTGASKNGSPGKIELANGGTLFLDEIGDMPIELQAVLLRVLEDKQVTRIGGKYARSVDFRLIAATNKKLLDLVEQKKFREDLYFRLSVIKIEIPPLRQRSGDALLLAEHFVQSYARKMNLPVPKISNAVRQKIQDYHWPGNVRQLENVMIYAVNMAQEGIIQLECLPSEIFKNNEEKADLNQPDSSTKNTPHLKDLLSFKDAEAVVIRNALAQTSGNITAASKLLKISKTTMYKKMKEYGIKEYGIKE